MSIETSDWHLVYFSATEDIRHETENVLEIDTMVCRKCIDGQIERLGKNGSNTVRGDLFVFLSLP